MRHWVVAFLILTATAVGGRVAAQQKTQPPGRAGAADQRVINTRGTALIRGRVYNAATGRPMRAASVAAVSDITRRTASTDDNGQFEWSDLPSGRYRLQASSVGFMALEFGEDPDNGGGRDIAVADGEKFIKADFRLPPGGVIGGRIVDEAGEPVEGVQVKAMTVEHVASIDRLVLASTPLTMKRTNDVGRFRIFGLQPGDYYVVATTGAFNTDPSPGEDMTSGYVVTYFPGTADVTGAEQVTVTAGRETAADFALVQSRTFDLSGTVLGPRGDPWSGADVVLAPGANTTIGLTATAAAAGDGSFKFAGIAPGQYILQVLPISPPPPLSGGLRFIGEPPSFASMPLTLTEDMTGIVLQGRQARPVYGTITLEGGDASFMAQSLRMVAHPTDFSRTPFAGFGNAVRINANWTFDIRDLWGPCVLDVAAPSGWALKAVKVGGEDRTDLPIDFDRESRRVEIVLTSQVTEISGTVTDDGRPLPHAPVIAFASDPDRWDMDSRFLRLVNADENGHYSVSGLPPAEYHVIALWRIRSGNAWKRSPFLESLVRASTRVVLHEGEHASADLRVARPR